MTGGRLAADNEMPAKAMLLLSRAFRVCGVDVLYVCYAFLAEHFEVLVVHARLVESDGLVVVV